MERASLPSALRSWGLPPPPPKRTQVHASKSHEFSKHPATSRSKQPAHHPPGKVERSNSSGQDAGAIYHKSQSSQSRPSSALDYATPSDRILHSSTVYIGPPRRKVGRPGGDGSNKNKSKKTSSGPFLTNPSSTNRDSLEYSQGLGNNSP